MRFAVTQKVLTFLLAIVAAVPLALSGEVAPVFAIGFAVLAVGGWFLEPPLTADPRFRRAVTVVIIALLAVQVARIFGGAPVARAGMEFALWLLGIKLCSRGNAGDYQQVVILAFLHGIAATIATFDISYAVSFVLFVVLSPPVLALAHLRNEMERRFRHDDRPEGRKALQRLLASKRVVTPRFVLGTGLLSLPVFLLTAVLFVGFPRFGLGFLGRLPGGPSLGGFADQVSIGDLEETRRDEAVTIRLEPFGGIPESPGRIPLKLRGAVFDRFEQGTWTNSAKSGWRRMARHGNDYPITRDLVAADDPGFEVLQEPLEPPILFVPMNTGLIATYPVAAKGVLRPRQLEVSRLGMIRYEDEAKVGVRYRVYLGGAGPSLGKGFRGLEGSSTYTELNAGTERLAARAVEIAPTGKPADRARALVEELKSRYSYADRLAPGERAGEGATALDRFLFSRRTGTCEHFASALTLMLRAVDVPARFVTGFNSAEWNPIGDYYAVRLRSAHAWTEAYIDGRWVTIDATPPNLRGGPPSEPSQVALLVDALRMRWHKYIVGYDASSQLEILTGLRQVWSGSGSRTSWSPDISKRNVLVGVGGLVLLVTCAWFVRRYRRREKGTRPKRPPPSASAAEATRLYLELEKRLRYLGFSRPSHQTPNEYARELASADQDLAQATGRVTARYNEVRFGQITFASGEVERLRADIRQIGRMRGSIP